MRWAEEEEKTTAAAIEKLTSLLEQAKIVDSPPQTEGQDPREVAIQAAAYVQEIEMEMAADGDGGDDVDGGDGGDDGDEQVTPNRYAFAVRAEPNGNGSLKPSPNVPLTAFDPEHGWNSWKRPRQAERAAARDRENPSAS